MLANGIARKARTGLGLANIALPVILFVALWMLAPDFTSLENLTNINSQITTLLIISIGQLLVVLIAGIDLSVGAVLSLTSAVLVTLDPTAALPAALGLGALVGLANGIGVALFDVHPLIMSLATGTFAQGLAFLIAPVPGGGVPRFLSSAARFTLIGIPGSFFWCLAFAVTAWLVISHSVFGLRLFAIGANAEVAALNGVRLRGPKILTYVLCSVTAVFAGAFLTARIATGDPTVGAAFSLDSVTALALGGVQLSGGVGSLAGALLGTITLGLMANGMNLIGISPFFRSALTGTLLLVAIGLQRRKIVGL